MSINSLLRDSNEIGEEKTFRNLGVNRFLSISEKIKIK